VVLHLILACPPFETSRNLGLLVTRPLRLRPPRHLVCGELRRSGSPGRWCHTAHHETEVRRRDHGARSSDPLGRRGAVWPGLGAPAGLTSGRVATAAALSRGRAWTSRLEPSSPRWRPRPAVNRAGLGSRSRCVGWTATVPSAGHALLGVCRKRDDNPLFLWWGHRLLGWSLGHRPEALFDTYDREVSMHNDVDDPDHRPSAPGRVRGPGDGPSARRSHPRNIHFILGPGTPELHEGVRRGLHEGVRPASDPSPGAIIPGHGGGGGSAAWADLRG